MMSPHRRARLLACAIAASATSAAAQPAEVSVVTRNALALDSLLQSRGPGWHRARSPHFTLYVERGGQKKFSARALLDSLEAARAHAARLLGVVLAKEPPVTVLITQSRTRFPHLLAPSSKGLTALSPPGHAELVILVHNDSVRPYTRHEIMHVVAQRAWGVPAALWVMEGLAVWADGRCQGSTVLTVARDLLRLEPGLTAPALTERFADRARRDRASAYVLAGSLIGYVLESGGSEGVRAMWRGGDVAATTAPWSADAVTAPWRAYVQHTAGNQPGLTSGAFARFGCG